VAHGHHFGDHHDVHGLHARHAVQHAVNQPALHGACRGAQHSEREHEAACKA
jgi:hypothetical protein